MCTVKITAGSLVAVLCVMDMLTLLVRTESTESTIARLVADAGFIVGGVLAAVAAAKGRDALRYIAAAALAVGIFAVCFLLFGGLMGGDSDTSDAVVAVIGGPIAFGVASFLAAPVRASQWSRASSGKNRGVESQNIHIRPANAPDEYPQLVDIWRSAVDATHDSLADEHRDEIQEKLAEQYFPQVEIFVAEVDGTPVGFMGVAGDTLEMLFVDAEHQNAGVDSALLQWGVNKQGVTTLDVNEDNTGAVAFYTHRGFMVNGMSPRDAQGWPYPILHLKRTPETTGQWVPQSGCGAAPD